MPVLLMSLLGAGATGGTFTAKATACILCSLSIVDLSISNVGLPQDAAQDLAAEGEEALSDEEWPLPTLLRRASGGGTSPTVGSGGGGGAPEEVARFSAAKARKHSLAAGVAAFNRCAYPQFVPKYRLRLPVLLKTSCALLCGQGAQALAA